LLCRSSWPHQPPECWDYRLMPPCWLSVSLSN
jgi:hypothetical protein